MVQYIATPNLQYRNPSYIRSQYFIGNSTSSLKSLVFEVAFSFAVISQIESIGDGWVSGWEGDRVGGEGG